MSSSSMHQQHLNVLFGRCCWQVYSHFQPHPRKPEKKNKKKRKKERGIILHTLIIKKSRQINHPNKWTYFIFLVSNPFAPPRNCICDSHRRPLCNLHPISISLDELAKNFSFRELRETKVHYLIKQLILNKNHKYPSNYSTKQSSFIIKQKLDNLQNHLPLPQSYLSMIPLLTLQNSA